MSKWTLFWYHAGWLLLAAFALPVTFGWVARVTVFKRDADDGRLHPEIMAENTAARQARDPLDTPEPDVDLPPWPEFPAKSGD